ncbi:holo-ACP synthase [Herminiimonas aquatilis]|uniref:Holo-[acyl-carrier-protein] synthase n=1 Tax=Herminiimonas aquatilis TaxID=345342 RepID=A0ABW2J631_9BURK
MPSKENSLNKSPGMLLGHGVDVVDIDDFSRILKMPLREFLDRHFTQNEIESVGTSTNSTERFAGRFATKEAVLKALRVGWGDGIAFTDVEVGTTMSGAPTIILHRKLKALEIERCISTWLVSTSHTGHVAVASVIALS